MYLELDDSLVAGLTAAVIRLIRLGNCPAIRFLVGILFPTSGNFNNPEGILHWLCKMNIFVEKQNKSTS